MPAHEQLTIKALPLEHGSDCVCYGFALFCFFLLVFLVGLFCYVLPLMLVYAGLVYVEMHMYLHPVCIHTYACTYIYAYKYPTRIYGYLHPIYIHIHVFTSYI